MHGVTAAMDSTLNLYQSSSIRVVPKDKSFFGIVLLYMERRECSHLSAPEALTRRKLQVYKFPLCPALWASLPVSPATSAPSPAAAASSAAAMAAAKGSLVAAGTAKATHASAVGHLHHHLVEVHAVGVHA